MKVNLKCFAKLSKDSQCDYRESTSYEIRKGETVHELATRAHVLPKNVEIVFVNNRVVNLETVLSDGDNVGLAPAVGGM
jgi:molybdopterin converting factor small subunit